MENSFLKNEIHELTTLLNMITTSLSCKSKTTEMENTLHEKSDCQELFKELSNVNCCTDNLTDSSAIDHQLPSLNNSIDFLIYTVSPTKVIKNKNVIHEIKPPAQRYFQTTAMTITKIIYEIQDFDHQYKLISHQLS